MKALVPIKLRMVTILAISALSGSVLCAETNSTIIRNNSDYIVLFDDDASQKSSSSAHPVAVSDQSSSGQKGPQSGDQVYRNYGLRSAVTSKNDTVKTSRNSRNADNTRYQVRSADGKDAQQTRATDVSSDGYDVKRAPQGQGGGTNSRVRTLPDEPQNTGTARGGSGYAIRSAGGGDVAIVKDKNTTEEAGGYAVRSTAAGNTASAPQTMGNAGQYQRRRADQGEVSGSSDTYRESSAGATRNDAAYQAKTITIGKGIGETSGGYAVKSAGARSTANRTDSYTTRSNSNVTTANLYEGTKFYDRRGYRIPLNSSQVNRTVIIMPVRGKSVAGVVIKDDPGRSIVVELATGGEMSFAYSDIDALVNI